MKHSLRAPLVAVALLASNCAPSTGFLVQGTVSVAFREGSAAPTDSGFRFSPQRRVDPTLAQGTAGGIQGTCSLGPNGRSLLLQQVGGDARGLRSITFTLPDWSQDSCANCSRGSVTFAIGENSFTGAQTAGAASPCEFTPTRTSSAYGMKLRATCTGLTSGTTTANLAVDLDLEQCDGPMTRN
jgi:hypothetical protein